MAKAMAIVALHRSSSKAAGSSFVAALLLHIVLYAGQPSAWPKKGVLAYSPLRPNRMALLLAVHLFVPFDPLYKALCVHFNLFHIKCDIILDLLFVAATSIIKLSQPMSVACTFYPLTSSPFPYSSWPFLPYYNIHFPRSCLCLFLLVRIDC